MSWPTAKRWADRYPRSSGAAGMDDRVLAAAPLSPNRTPQPVVRKIVHLRWKQRLGPVADRRPGRACRPRPCTRCWSGAGLNRLTHVDRATGEPIRRYEHDHPGALLHVDVKKLGNIPDGGGWRYVGRQQGDRNRARHPGKPKQPARHNPKMGTAFVHTVIDDHSRVAYAEIHDDETAATAIAVLRNAVAWFAARGVTVERVLSDNGSAYKSHLWRDTCAELGITAKKTRPYRPQTNGKIERFHRTLADGWASSSSTTPNQPAEQPCQHGSTTTTTTGPTPRSARPPPITRLTNLLRSVQLAHRDADAGGGRATAGASSPSRSRGRCATSCPRRRSAAGCQPDPVGQHELGDRPAQASTGLAVGEGEGDVLAGAGAPDVDVAEGALHLRGRRGRRCPRVDVSCTTQVNRPPWL